MTIAGTTAPRPVRSRVVARLRFAASWAVALALVGYGVPRAVDLSWRGVLPVLASIPWPALLTLVGVWLLGLWVHSFLLTAAAPALTRRRALTLNVTGSALANVVPLGGAAGVELNRRMMRTWGIDTRGFTGYTFLTNVWDVGAKLLLPVLGVLALTRAGEAVTPPLQTASTIAGAAFVGFVLGCVVLLRSPRGAAVAGRLAERAVRAGLRVVGRDRELGLAAALLDIRRDCAGLVARGWHRMSLGIAGYLALQCLLLGLCLHLTGGGSTWADVLAAYAVERLLTIVPITPGGIGVADLGLVGMLLTLGGDPAAVTAAAVLYRLFVFAVEIPVGGGALGLWVLGQRLTARRRPVPRAITGELRRVAHVTDAFLPRLGGIETHVDDLVRHQRAAGLDADVLTPTEPGAAPDPSWVRRISVAEARRAVATYDVVHVHVSVLSPYGISVARAATAAGVPVLVTVHSMWTGLGALLRLVTTAGLRHWPAEWSAVSDAAAQTFRRSLRGAAVTVLPNAIDLDRWRPAVADGAGRARSGATEPVSVVSVMRLMPRKRPLQLVRAFDRVARLLPEHDLRLVIVGDGPLRQRVERLVRRRGLESRVRVTGRIPRAEVREQLRAASVYVAPAPDESFGIAALEARCAGLPVVADRRSGVAAFIRDRVEGLLVGSDAELAAALADLAVDADLRARITDHNRRVGPGFDWADALADTERLYRRAADRLAEAAPGSVRPLPLAAPA